MRTVLLSLFTIISSALTAQNILDSIQLFDYPVKEGVIYRYENKNKSVCTQACADALSIVSVVTQSDSVYHFEEGKVAGIFTIDNVYAVTIQNIRNEFITYSNLQAITVKKGDKITRGMSIGTTAQSNDLDFGINQVDILILRKVKQLPYRKTIEYIRSKSTPRKIYYSSL